MSSSYVRILFRDWAQLTASATGYPFYDTINMEPDTSADAVWWTASFTPEFQEGTYCNKGFVERGFIGVHVFGKPGIGDLPSVQALESIVPSLLSHVDPTQRLVLEDAEPVFEASAGSAKQDYSVSVNINYAHSL